MDKKSGSMAYITKYGRLWRYKSALGAVNETSKELE